MGKKAHYSQLLAKNRHGAVTAGARRGKRGSRFSSRRATFRIDVAGGNYIDWPQKKHNDADQNHQLNSGPEIEFKDTALYGRLEVNKVREINEKQYRADIDSDACYPAQAEIAPAQYSHSGELFAHQVNRTLARPAPDLLGDPAQHLHPQVIAGGYAGRCSRVKVIIYFQGRIISG